MAGLPPHIRASPNTLALSFSLQPHFVCRSIKPEFADPKQANREVPARLSKLSFTIIYGTNEARPGDEVTLGAGEKLTRIHMATWELTGLPPILFKARSTRFRGLVVRCFGVGGWCSYRLYCSPLRSCPLHGAFRLGPPQHRASGGYV